MDIITLTNAHGIFTTTASGQNVIRDTDTGKWIDCPRCKGKGIVDE